MADYGESLSDATILYHWCGVVLKWWRGAPAKGVGRLYRRESSNLSCSANKKGYPFSGILFCYDGEIWTRATFAQQKARVSAEKILNKCFFKRSQQSKEIGETQTCECDTYRLCDLNGRTKSLLLRQTKTAILIQKGCGFYVFMIYYFWHLKIGGRYEKKRYTYYNCNVCDPCFNVYCYSNDAYEIFWVRKLLWIKIIENFSGLFAL